jgi:zinc transport system permease protein
MLEIFQYDFMIRAFIAGLTIAVIAPLIGNFLVVRRLSLIADTLSHVALAGVAIGLLTKTEPIITTIILTTLASLLIERLRTTSSIPGEAVLAMFLPVGLALSITLIQLANGLNVNLFSYLFGSITTVTTQDVWFTLGLGVVTVIVVGVYYHKLLFTSFDEESARVSGIQVDLVNTILIVLTAITVTLAMRVVGILLIGALMVIPVTTAMQLARSFRQTVLLSIGVALLSVTTGLFLAYYLNLPAGGTIVLSSFLFFCISTLLKKK